MCPIAKEKIKILWQFECKKQWIPEMDNRFMFSVLPVMGFAINWLCVILFIYFFDHDTLLGIHWNCPNYSTEETFCFAWWCSKTSVLFSWKECLCGRQCHDDCFRGFMDEAMVDHNKPDLVYYYYRKIAHNKQFYCSVAPGHDLYWVVQVSPQSSTCPVQPSWHFMNYLYSSHWSALESYNSNSKLFFYVFLLL